MTRYLERIAGVWQRYLMFLTVIVACVALWQLGVRIWYVLQFDSFSPIDAPVYWTMGRGILNGLQPYTDLFEVKPPGVFFLSAASLFLFDDPRFGNILTALSLLALPLITFMSVGRATPIFLRTMAAVGTLLLMLYASLQAGAWQTEIFGVPFAMLAVLLQYRICGWQSHRVLFAVLAGFCMALSLGLKEPFLFTLIASGLLLSRTPKDAVFMLLIPLSIAGASGLALMAGFGYLDPYLSLYIPAMLGHHLTDLTPVPFWQRGLNLPLLLARLISGSPLLPMIVGSWIVTPLILRQENKKQRPLWCLWMFIAIAAIPAIILVRLAQETYAMMFPVIKLAMTALQLPDDVTLATLIIIAGITLLIGCALGIVLLFKLWKNPRLPRIAVWLLAIYLTILATGIGGGQPFQHYVFAVPTYMALLLLCVQTLQTYWTQSSARESARWLLLLTLLAIALLHQRPVSELRTMLNEREAERVTNVAAARQLDAVLDACNIDRYFMLDTGVQKLMPYTRHSPLNFYFFRDPWEESGYGPAFSEAARSRLSSAEVLIAGSSTIPHDDDMTRTIEQNFTTASPACANNLPQPQEVHLLWHVSP